MPYWVWKTLMGITIGSMVGWTIGTNVGFVSSSIESYNTQKATTGKVNGWKVLGDGIIGGYSSGFGGLVGGTIEGGLSVNTTNPIAQVAIGAGSNTADGIVSRYTEALMRNWFTKDPKINVRQYTFDEDAMVTDAVIGGGSTVLGMGADKILGKVLKKVPVAAVAKWFIDQRNKICGTSNSVNSGNPIRKGLDINLQFFAMDTQADEAVEAVAKNSDVTDAGTVGGHVATQGDGISVRELISESDAAKKWGELNDGTNQGVRHFSDYWEKYPERIPSLEQRLGVEKGSFDNSIDGFNNFTSQAERVINEATLTGNVRNINGKSIYYIEGAINPKKGVVVIVRDGKIQSMMPSDFKSFSRMQ